MIIEPFIAGCVGLATFGAMPEKTQGGKGAFHRCRPCHESAFNANRVSCQRKTGCGNACGPIGCSLIDDQSIGGVCLMQEIAERLPLRLFQFCVESAHGLKETGYLRARDHQLMLSSGAEPKSIYNIGNYWKARVWPWLRL